MVKTVKVGQRPRGVILSKDAKWLLICASDDNNVQVFDARTMEFVKNLPSGPDPELFVLHPSGNPLYIANEDDNLVTVVDIETRTRCWQKSRSAWSPRAWASARTASCW